MGVKGKVVAITGRDSGIAERPARAGARVMLADRLRETAVRLEDARDRVERSGAVSWLVTDVRRHPEGRRPVDVTRERFGRLDVLVSSAGVARRAPLGSTTWQRSRTRST